jgi:hypothetical protein
MASAPEASRAWLLIEYRRPWPQHPLDAELPGPLRAAACAAAALGVRVQLIRGPRHRRPARVTPAPSGDAGAAGVFLGWTAGSRPWLRRGRVTSAEDLAGSDLDSVAAGRVPAFGTPVTEPLFLVCTQGSRNVCCARFGCSLSRTLASQHPRQVWETTHVGGDMYAANLVILPHGLYYGPVGEQSAAAAIAAYQRGEVILDRYRGRAGLPHTRQAAEHTAMIHTGRRAIRDLA